jgi:hypothetical protein
MTYQGWNVQLSAYAARDWRANFFPVGIALHRRRLGVGADAVASGAEFHEVERVNRHDGRRSAEFEIVRSSRPLGAQELQAEPAIALDRLIEALPAQRLPQADTTQMHSKDARLIGVAPLVFDLVGLDSAAASIARRAAPRTRVHLAGKASRQVAIIELTQDHVGSARAVHGSTLRSLPAHEDTISATADLARPPVDEKLVPHPRSWAASRASFSTTAA